MSVVRCQVSGVGCWVVGLLIGWSIVLMTSCAPSADIPPMADVAIAQVVENSVSATLEALPSPTATNPPPIIIEAPTNPPPEFSLLTEAELTAQAPTETPIPTETAVPTQSPFTPTPGPTFTPPSLPYTSADDHYWFRRPVPEGTAVWTDKAYPYGSNKGGTLRVHHGVEFNVGYDTPVLSAASGTIVFAGSDDVEMIGPHTNFYGKAIVIEHNSKWNGQSVYTLYAHLNDVQVTVGQQVGVLDQIGLSGATGVADGAHLHFEVRVGQNSYQSTRNPLLWLYPFPQKAAVAGRIVYPDGSLAPNAPVELIRVDANNRYQATTTYAEPSVNPDGKWQENFVIDDVDPGYYEAVVRTGGKKYKAEVWVFAYQTAFVEIVLGGE